MKNTSIKLLSLLSLALVSSGVFAGVVSNIAVLPAKDQRLVKITFADRAVTPIDMQRKTLSKQIILDLPSSSFQLDRTEFQYNDTVVQGIRVLTDGNKVRLVVDLHNENAYSIKQQNNKEIWLTINTNQPVANTNTSSYQPTINIQRETASAVAAPIPDQVGIQFKKNDRNQSMVELTLPNINIEPVISKKSDRVLLIFKNLNLDPSAQKELDVSEFGAAVTNIKLSKIGKDAQVEVKVKGDNWQHKSSKGGNTFNLIVDSSMSLFTHTDTVDKKTFTGGKLTLDFQDVDVRTILQIIAKESKMNIVASDSVQGKLTINLKDVPWDQALDLVMQARNLDMRKEGNIINIAPRQELMKQDREVAQAQREAAEHGPLLTRTFQLKYKRVEDLQAMFDSAKHNSGDTNNRGNTMMTNRGSTMVDLATNTLIITDTQKTIDKFDRLITQLDVPLRQVMIEARIVEAEDGFMRALGVKFGGASRHVGANMVQAYDNQVISDNNRYNRGLNQYNAGRYQEQLMLSALERSQPGYEGNRYEQSPAAPEPIKMIVPTLLSNINLPVAATSTLAFVHQWGSKALGLEIQAAQEENRAKHISSPRVLTQDRQEASLEEGIDFPYQSSAENGATKTEFKKAVTGITVTPQITPDGNVIMRLQVNKDNITDFTTGATSVKRVDTTAMIENGGTMIIGGIYVESESNSTDKVPLLGDIPVLGNLFKSKTRNKAKREMLIFITPRIIDTTAGNLYY